MSEIFWIFGDFIYVSFFALYFCKKPLIAYDLEKDVFYTPAPSVCSCNYSGGSSWSRDSGHLVINLYLHPPGWHCYDL